MVTVLVARGDVLEIDRGLTHGLRMGDRGSVFYRLMVAGESKRIELGQVEIVSLGIDRAVTSVPARGKVRPGFLVEFELEPERVEPGSIVAAVRDHLGEDAATEVARRYLDELGQAPETPEIPETPPDADVESPPTPSATMLRFATGRYAIGLDIQDAGYYNETPRFETELAAFAIDPAATGLTGLDFGAARRHCRALGKRLPTEFEWEVAARHPRFRTGAVLEWTSSWYLPYPGNRRPEAEYGERFRVLRGAVEAGSPAITRRHYFEPGSTSSKVGFRCAVSSSGAQ